MPPEILTGVYVEQVYRPADAHETGDTYLIGRLDDGTTIKGNARPEDMVPHLTYRFEGAWAEPTERDRKFGNGKPAFQFKRYTRAEPHSRHGLVSYLQKYCRGIGPQLAGKLWDQYRGEACRILREDPDRAVREVQGLRDQVAADASASLAKLAKFEDARIDLANLLTGRGFPGATTDKVLKLWGVEAPEKIRRDPFCLIEHDLPGAGFVRVDRLYIDCGNPPDHPKRQMFAVWWILQSSSEGHTWHFGRALEEKLRQMISGVHVNALAAVNLGLQTGRLVVRRDERSQVWVAEAKSAANEQAIADRVAHLIYGPPVLPRYSEPLPGECADQAPHELEHDGGARTVLYEGVGGEVIEIDGKQYTIRDIGQQDPETLAGIGRRTGICQFCGRKLVHPESRARGYGPTCAANNYLPWGEIEGDPELKALVQRALRQTTDDPFPAHAPASLETA